MEKSKPKTTYAFPCETTELVEDKNIQDWEYGARGTKKEKVKHPGMTLRDYFAAKAMQATISENTNPNYFEARAREAYKMADEMLKHREL